MFSEKTKFQMSNQRLGVNQLLGVTPNCWPKNFFFVFLRFSSWALREPLVRMMKKVLFYWFSSVFYRFQFRPCGRVHKHAFAGRNTQQVQCTHSLVLNVKIGLESTQNAENFTKKAPQFKSQWLCKKTCMSSFNTFVKVNQDSWQISNELIPDQTKTYFCHMVS